MGKELLALIIDLCGIQATLLEKNQLMEEALQPSNGQVITLGCYSTLCHCHSRLWLLEYRGREGSSVWISSVPALINCYPFR